MDQVNLVYGEAVTPPTHDDVILHSHIRRLLLRHGVVRKFSEIKIDSSLKEMCLIFPVGLEVREIWLAGD